MADTRSPEQRRRIMQAVKTKNTGPEVTVRRILHRLGYRFRLHRKDLPGRPDIVLPKYRTAIFVHGCFWHAHGCPKGQPPKSRPEYWLPKLGANVKRDAEKAQALRELGWRVETVWQCETRDPDALEARLRQLVDESKKAIDTERSDT
ncbi:MAG: very short patch repair endonuclease [Myxococcota bacterium]